MKDTLGNRIAACRREKGLTQEELAQAMNVSAQAVSKWENDLCCPDVLSLPQLAELLGVTADRLLTGEGAQVRLVPPEERKPPEQTILRIYVESDEGDKVRVNLPMALVEAALEIGLSLPQVRGSAPLEHIDLEKVLQLARMGLAGRLAEAESADGDRVVIEVE